MTANVPSIYSYVRSDCGRTLGLGVPLFCMWLLALATFSIPGREGPDSMGSLDTVALVKVASRAVALLLLTVAVWRSRTLPNASPVLRAALPFGLFVMWAILSTAWSPLKGVSLGQAGSLAAQLMLATCIAMRWSGSGDTSTILKHLSILLLIVSVTLVTVHLLAPEYSGLNREADTDGAVGLVHPTSAGATASVGLVILLAARLLWDWRWAHTLLAPGVLFHSALLVMAHSRTALAMAMLLVLLMLAFLTSRLVFSAIVVSLSLAVGAYLTLDPSLEAAEGMLEPTKTFVTRGEREEQLQSFNGREELWEIVRNEIRKSPIRGWGYFVTSETGRIEVWGSSGSNMTAHNIVLQVLVSTGLIGAALFACALAVPTFRVLMSAKRGRENRALVVFLVLLSTWYLGWGLFCSSFMGPLQPETVAFYSTFGLALSCGLGSKLGTREFESRCAGFGIR